MMIDWDEQAGCGTCQRPVAAERAEAAVLSEAEARSLAALGTKIGRLWPDRFVDIEWCLDSERRMHIVQCRPVTSIPSGEFTVIDNSNIVEGYPGLTGALSCSVLKDAYCKNFSALLRSIGIARARMDKLRRALEHMTAYIDGRIYYNLSSWYRVMDVVPGCGRWLAPLLDAMIGVTEKESAGAGLSPSSRMSVRYSLTYTRVAAKLLWKFLTLRQAMQRYKRSFASLEKHFRSQRLEALSNHGLIDLWLHVDTRIFRLIHIALFNDLVLMMLVPAARKSLARAGFKEAESLFNALMCGEERMESVLPVRSIIGLSEKVQSHPELAQALRSAAASRRKSDLDAALALSKDFAEKFSAHLQRYGDRLPEELKIETISFRDDPLLLADTVLRQTDAGMTVAGMREREQAVRREAEATLSGRLAGHSLQQHVIGYLLRRTRESLANRESARLDRARFTGFLRSLSRCLGASLAREGVLAEAADIIHLSFDEVKNYIMGSALETDLKGLAGRRKVALEAARERNPAERMLLRGTVYRNFIVQQADAQCGSGDGCLFGTPCSPGLVHAEAVVIENPATAPTVAGKIIVARMTDPGWVFLMASAAGLIVEKGSLLTHTAIIGRELGIPTIVGVTGAVSRIKSGSRVRMDGTTGKIDLNI
jgi:pyruvate,water dikinase